jgi:hypothetical protein
VSAEYLSLEYFHLRMLHIILFRYCAILSTKVGTKFRRQVAVAQSVQFARGLWATEFVLFEVLWHISKFRFVVRVLGCKHRGPGFDSLSYQIFCVAVGLERGPLSLVSVNEELLEKK